VRCFKNICTKARHASRKQVALYWIKMIDKKVTHRSAGGDVEFKDDLKRKLQRKGPPGSGLQAQSQYDDEDDDLLDVDEDDEEDVDYSPYRNKGVTSNVILHNLPTLGSGNNGNGNPLSAHNIMHHAHGGFNHHRNNDNDSDPELDHSSSVFLRSLRSQPPSNIPGAPSPSATSTASTLQTLSSPLSALTMYSAAAVPHATRKKDFSNVSILNRKRKSVPDDQLAQWSQMKKADSKRLEDARAKERANSNTRTNLRMLSQLALGLR